MSIYANFGAFRSPKLSEYGQVMRSGMVVLDANVLLNLYRYNDRARQDLLGALARLKNTLWVPHRKRRTVSASRASAHEPGTTTLLCSITVATATSPPCTTAAPAPTR